MQKELIYMTKEIDFYFDFISPYSYLAHQKIKTNKDVNFNYKPVLVGGLHNLQGITAPAFIKAKLKHMISDCNLIAKKNNLNLNKGFSYLISHGKLDISHVEFYKNLVNKVDDKNLQSIIIDTAKIIYLLWGNVFDEIAEKNELKMRKVA